MRTCILILIQASATVYGEGVQPSLLKDSKELRSLREKQGKAVDKVIADITKARVGLKPVTDPSYLNRLVVMAVKERNFVSSLTVAGFYSEPNKARFNPSQALIYYQVSLTIPHTSAEEKQIWDGIVKLADQVKANRSK